jgi:uncharacterized protein DUF4837
MKKKALLISFLFLTLISCMKSDKITLVDSSGSANHVLIVIKNSDWQGKIGDALRKVISKPVVGLPQDENQFSINHVPPRTFNSLFKRTRNILFVGIDTTKIFYMNSNIYAYPQKTLTILGENEEELIDNINSHEEEIISTFKESDLKIYQKKITKDFHKFKNIETFNKLKFTLKIPTSFNKVEDNGEFLWYRNNLDKGGLLNIIAYEIPNSNNRVINQELLNSFRDSIGKKFIPGQFDKTFFRTEPQYKPVTKEIVLSGEKTIESRGLWIVEGDYMGGPFVSYAIEDFKNNRLLVVTGFIYSPATKKRDYIFQLEAILKTVLLKKS